VRALRIRQGVSIESDLGEKTATDSHEAQNSVDSYQTAMSRILQHSESAQKAVGSHKLKGKARTRRSLSVTWALLIGAVLCCGALWNHVQLDSHMAGGFAKRPHGEETGPPDWFQPPAEKALLTVYSVC
jgi:hypothetical protein